MSMDEPQPDAPEGFADRGILDRSQQAARFLDLTLQHGLVDDDDDISIDPSAFGVLRPGSIDPGSGLGGFSLDDDGDVFGDGNGFGAEPPFGG